MKTTPTLLLLLIFLSLPAALPAQETDKTFDPAFTHVVYFWLHRPDNTRDRADFEKALRKLLADSRYAKTNFFGTPPGATREVVDDSFTYGLILTFESAEAQEAYQQEQAHLDFIESAGHLWKKVMVYDAIGITP